MSVNALNHWRVENKVCANRYGAVTKFLVTNGKVGTTYDTKAAAVAVRRALEGNCEPGGWATLEAAKIQGRLF